MDYEYHTKVLYWTYGLGTTWMIVLGYLVYYWYPNQIYNGWWAIQCPVTAYTEKRDGTASVVEYKVNGWTRDLCLDASPVRQMTVLSYFMMTYYSISWVSFIVNAIWFHDGSFMHEMWWRWF
jgi:hypothetical protein